MTITSRGSPTPSEASAPDSTASDFAAPEAPLAGIITPDGTGPNSTGPNRTGPNRTGPNSTGPEADVPDAELAGLVAHYQQGSSTAVAEAAAALCARYPAAFALHQLAGLLLAAAGAYALAEPYLANAARLRPGDPDIHLLHGSALGELGQADAAALAFARTVALAPDHAEALGRLGMALFENGQHEGALAALDRALARTPHDVQILNNRGVVLQDSARLDEAAADYVAALDLARDHVDARANLGAVRKEQGRTAEAVMLLEQALALDPAHYGAWDNLGAALGDAERFADALAANARALAIRPGSTSPLARSIAIKTRICDWSGHADFAAVATTLGIGGEAVPPHPMLALDDDPARQRQRAECYAAKTFREVTSAGKYMPAPRGAASRRLRIGYFSADFHDHATMYLLEGLLRVHDRSRF
ncbi:MAG: tetratricopeptide repeat protein, partial [Novosphingobium sp.]